MSSPLLVITDLWMPGMAGDELCSRIRASPTLRSCYIIMTTAKQLTLTERVHGRYAGMDAYLIKPYEKLDLHACIQTAARVLGTQAEMLDRLASQELELNKWQRLLSLAICYRCKKVSSFENEWQGLDNFLQENTGINFKITVCPHCKS